MQNLFLIDGASGVGKSDLLRWVVDNASQDISYVRKFTTRTSRPYEIKDPNILLDLDFIDDLEFKRKKLDYTYSYGGSHYGFSISHLNDKIRRYNNVFVIVRNIGTTRKIADDYSFMNVIPMFIYTDRGELADRLKKQKLTPNALQFRLQRSEIALRDYYREPEVYREVIINNSNQDTFHSTIDRIIKKYQTAPKIDETLFSTMMSYNPSNKKLDDYYEAIEAAVKNVSPDYRCRRVDRIAGSQKIAAEFRALAAKSRCVIVDLTENKQNVYYELGYLHAAGKTCIITAEQGTQPSFYPREYKIVFYESARDLREKLTVELRGIISLVTGI